MLTGDNLHVRYNDGHKKSIQNFYLDEVRVKFEELDIPNALLRMEHMYLRGMSVDIEKFGESLDEIADDIAGDMSEESDSTGNARPLRIEVADFQIKQSHFALVNRRGANDGDGINYGDMSIDSIDIAVTNFTMEGLDFTGAIRNLSFEEKSGFALSGLSVDFHPLWK